MKDSLNDLKNVAIGTATAGHFFGDHSTINLVVTALAGVVLQVTLKLIDVYAKRRAITKTTAKTRTK